MEPMPADLKKALTAKAKAQWDTLTPVARRDFIRWIEGAKQADTRKRRIEKANSVLAEGKRRPCCYEVVPFDLYRGLDQSPKAKATWKTLTPDERRDLVSLIDAQKDKEKKSVQVAKICVMLAKGRRHP